MFVLDSEEVSRHLGETLNTVDTLTVDEAATLYEAYEYAVINEGLEWLYVAEVYKSNLGYFYFYSERGMSSDFNIVDYLVSKCSSVPQNANTLSLKVFLGKSKGLPEHELGWVEPVVPVQEADVRPNVPVNLFAYSEDDESTGYLGEDDLPEFNSVVYRLLIENDGKEVFITQKEMVIGRSETADIRILGNKSISRKHAKIWVDDDKNLMVQDTGSSNGIYVDSIRVGRDPVNITDSNVLSFGNAVVRNMGVLSSVS